MMMRACAWCAVATFALATLASTAALAGPLVYVSNERSDDVTIIDATTDRVVATVPVGGRPRGIGVSPDGRAVYVALGNENAIGVLDAESRKVTRKLKAGSVPETFAVS